MPNYYRPSQAAPPMAIVATLAASLGPAILLGMGYAWLVDWLSPNAMRLLLPAVLGLLCALVVERFSRFFHLRNAWALGILGVLAAMVALASAWAMSYALAHPNASLAQCLHPLDLIGWLGERLEVDSLLLRMPKRGEIHKIDGSMMAGAWLIETLVVLATSSLGYFTVGVKVFCETCQRWAVADPPIRLSWEATRSQALPNLLQGLPWNPVEFHVVDPVKLKPGEGCVKLTLSTCPDCTESSYLTVETIQGEAEQMQFAELARLQQVTPAEVAALRGLALRPHGSPPE